MGELSPLHLLIIAAVFVLLFGAKRLPDGARSLGRSLRIFKSELRGMHEDDEQAKTSGATAEHVPASLPAATPVATPVAAPVVEPVVAPGVAPTVSSTPVGPPPAAS